MDYCTISFDCTWETDPEVAKQKRFYATIQAVIFGFTSICLLISIIRTICTNPGNIPDHKEWDMSTDASEADSGNESANLRHRQEDQ